MPTCYSPVRRAPIPSALRRRKLRTRLACVKHAASVRSEPESNSRLKLVALKAQIPPRGGTRPSGRTFESLGYLKFTERVLAHFIRLSKSRPPCPAEWLQANRKYRDTRQFCQAGIWGLPWVKTHLGAGRASKQVVKVPGSGCQVSGKNRQLADRVREEMPV